MATNVRRFNSATPDKITLAPGATHFAFGPGSVLALCLTSNFALGNRTVFAAGATNAVSYMLQVLTTGTVALRLNGTEVHSTATVAINSWYIIGATKATGTATPRMHIYDCTAGTWTHENASGTIANSSVPITRSALGVTAAEAAGWLGDVQLGAVWDSVLDDAAFTALTSLQAILTAAPVGMWILDQASTATAVPDYTGNGADQTALTGTSVQSDTIPNFDMSYPSPPVTDANFAPVIYGRGAA